MREIKFRAWDKRYNLLHETGNYNWSDMYLTSEGELWEVTERSSCYQTYMDKECVSENYILMQYTGLKDKNGVEIYEGDVVKWEIPGFQPLRKKECVGEVTWGRKDKNTGSWEVYQHLLEGEIFEGEYDNNSAFGLYCDVKRYEVIGNIYQNPELLK